MRKKKNNSIILLIAIGILKINNRMMKIIIELSRILFSLAYNKRG
jgi:hypothetical protein